MPETPRRFVGTPAVRRGGPLQRYLAKSAAPLNGTLIAGPHCARVVLCVLIGRVKYIVVPIAVRVQDGTMAYDSDGEPSFWLERCRSLTCAQVCARVDCSYPAASSASRTRSQAVRVLLYTSHDLLRRATVVQFRSEPFVWRPHFRFGRILRDDL